MTIREATVDDVPRIAEMAKRFLDTTGYGAIVPNVKRASLAGAAEAIIRHGGVILLAQKGPPELRHTVGFCALMQATHVLTGEDYADEVALWVEPEHRKGTVGGRLLLAAEAWTRQKSIPCLKMVAPVGSRLHQHYQHRGYVPVETSYQKRLS